MTQLRLPIGTGQHRSRPASSSRLVNCYAEQLPPDAKTPVVVQRTDGVVEAPFDDIEVGTGPIYGMLAALDLVFVISGSQLWQFGSNLIPTLVGSIGAGASIQNCDMAANTTSLVVVNNPRAYYYTPSTVTFGQITDADFLGASDVEFLDNYLLFVEPDSGVFFGSDLGSATSFDALNFATAEGSPDELVGEIVDHRQALLFGTDTVELWDDTGQGDFPFGRAANGFVQLGCLNGRTIVGLDNSVFWLASDYTIRRLSGVTPVRVSTHAVEQFLSSIEVASANAWTYSRGGHIFYVLTCNQGTKVFDVTTGEWHDRQTYGRDFWRWGSTANAFGYQFVGDSTSNSVGYLSPTAYDELGETLRMEVTFQPVYAQQRRAFHRRLEIVCEVGNTTVTTGQGSAPVMMASFSDDGGATWNNLPNRSLGAIGERRVRVTWFGLGSAEQRIYRVAVSDPVPVYITDALLEVEGGRL